MNTPCTILQQGEGAESGCHRQQRGGDRQQGEAHQDAEPAVDAPREQRHEQAGDGHAHGAGVDGEAHGGGAHLVVPHQGGQDRLRREQVDHGEEGRQRDDALAHEDAAA